MRPLEVLLPECSPPVGFQETFKVNLITDSKTIFLLNQF